MSYKNWRKMRIVKKESIILKFQINVEVSYFHIRSLFGRTFKKTDRNWGCAWCCDGSGGQSQKWRWDAGSVLFGIVVLIVKDLGGFGFYKNVNLLINLFVGWNYFLHLLFFLFNDVSSLFKFNLQFSSSLTTLINTLFSLGRTTLQIIILNRNLLRNSELF